MQLARPYRSTVSLRSTGKPLFQPWHQSGAPRHAQLNGECAFEDAWLSRHSFWWETRSFCLVVYYLFDFSLFKTKQNKKIPHQFLLRLSEFASLCSVVVSNPTWVMPRRRGVKMSLNWVTDGFRRRVFYFWSWIYMKKGVFRARAALDLGHQRALRSVYFLTIITVNLLSSDEICRRYLWDCRLNKTPDARKITSWNDNLSILLNFFFFSPHGCHVAMNWP